MRTKDFLLRKILHVIIGIITLFILKYFIYNLGVRATIFYSGIVFVFLLFYEMVRIDFNIDLLNFYCKSKEKKSFHALTFTVAVGIIVFSIFDVSIAFCAMSISIFGDWFASLIGYFFGSHKIPYNKKKSVEGSIAYLVMGIIVGMFFLNFYVVLVMAIVASLIESICNYTEDNFIVPFVISYLGFFLLWFF